jgi:hypothetical protein
MEIASGSGVFSVRRLRLRHFEKPYLVRTIGNDVTEEEREEVMNVTFTNVSIEFGYTVTYNCAEGTNEDLTDCLETATEDLLLDSFDCPYGEDQTGSSSVGAGRGMDPLQKELERSDFRYLDENINSFPSEAPSSAPTVGGDDCDYTVSATVDAITDIRKLLMCTIHQVNVLFETILSSYPLLCHSMYRYPGQ